MSFQEWDEKRCQKRYGSDLKARFRSRKDPAGYAEGTITNINGGGLFLYTPEPLKVGTEVQLHIDIVTPFGESEEIDAQARVIWVNHKKDEEGMGLQFVDIDPHSKYAILACAHRGEDTE